MVDWTSPAELAREAVVFERFMHIVIGVYIWEWIISLHFDWQFITRRKRFHWPMIFYFLGRYCMLFSAIGIAIVLNVQNEIDCQALYNFTTVVGASAIGFASVNLSLRTMAVWSRPRYIVIPLIVVILGHFGLLLHIVLKATWIAGKGCVITYTDNSSLAATFIYTMIFDFVILTLTALKLFQTTTATRSRLTNLIFKDGLIYFIVTFLMNILATIFILLNLNPIMSVIVNVPGTVISTIVACRVVRRLNDYSSAGPETFASRSQDSAMAFSSGIRPNISMLPKDGIHLQMETFPSSSSEVKTTIVDYPSVGQVGTNENRDLESGDFKAPPIVPPSP